MKNIKKVISRINWKLIIFDFFLAYFIELLVINSFIVGTLPEFKEYEEMYWTMFGRCTFAFIILVIITRLMISAGQGNNPYMKPTKKNYLIRVNQLGKYLKENADYIYCVFSDSSIKDTTSEKMVADIKALDFFEMMETSSTKLLLDYEEDISSPYYNISNPEGRNNK